MRIAQQFETNEDGEASRHGHLEVSRVLVDHGANVDARQRTHWTPMHLSARNGHLGIVELLLKRSADIQALNNEGETPYHLSLAYGHREIADLLRQHSVGGERFEEIFL